MFWVGLDQSKASLQDLKGVQTLLSSSNLTTFGLKTKLQLKATNLGWAKYTNLLHKHLLLIGS